MEGVPLESIPAPVKVLEVARREQLQHPNSMNFDLLGLRRSRLEVIDRVALGDQLADGLQRLRSPPGRSKERLTECEDALGPTPASFSSSSPARVQLPVLRQLQRQLDLSISFDDATRSMVNTFVEERRLLTNAAQDTGGALGESEVRALLVQQGFRRTLDARAASRRCTVELSETRGQFQRPRQERRPRCSHYTPSCGLAAPTSGC